MSWLLFGLLLLAGIGVDSPDLAPDSVGTDTTYSEDSAMQFGGTGIPPR